MVGNIINLIHLIMSTDKTNPSAQDEQTTQGTQQTETAKDDCGCADFITHEQAKTLAGKSAEIVARIELPEKSEGAIDTITQLRDVVAAEFTQDELLILATKQLVSMHEMVREHPLNALLSALSRERYWQDFFNVLKTV